MFRKMVLPGLIAYGVLHRCAEWLRASVSDEQPHGPSPLHGTLSHWPPPPSLLPFVHHLLGGLELSRTYGELYMSKHKHGTSNCALKCLPR